MGNIVEVKNMGNIVRVKSMGNIAEVKNMGNIVEVKSMGYSNSNIFNPYFSNIGILWNEKIEI